MPRVNNIAVQNNFSRGLITEATGLNFPENACTEADNCTFNRLGEVRRRLGFDLEGSFENFAQDMSGNAVVTYVWNNAAGEGDVSFVVVQIGNLLHFYFVAPDSSLSANKHADTIDLTDFAPAGVTTVSTLECQFSSGNGLLFVTNQRLNSFYVTYDADLDTFTGTEIDIQIRDFEGDLADALDIDERPTSDLAGLTSAHEYNLKNQGWTDTTLGAWDTARTDMPSNSDVSWYFKDSNDAFDFTTVDDRVVGNTPAPKGHYIYSLYNVFRSGIVAGATDEEIELDRVSTCAFFAGRVFYSGLRVPKHNSRIFFSQIVEREDQYGKCYQTNDPTSEQLFDLLPSDGGMIDLLEAGTIIKMMPVRNTLLVFATNGLWAITGSQGLGFTANDYSIDKISSIRNISHTSFVSVDGAPFWWNLDGIYTLRQEPESGRLSVISITDETIRTFYEDILAESKQTAKGVYSPLDKTIQWIYRSSPVNNFEEKYQYDRLLTYDLRTQAFYPWSVSFDIVKIMAVVDVYGLSGIFQAVEVIDGTDNVIDGTDNVVAYTTSSAGTTSVIKYLVNYDFEGNSVITFGENYIDLPIDWESADSVGEGFSSHVVTGYLVHGQAARKFQTNYVNVYLDNTLDSSFKIQGQWDFATSEDSGRWSTEQVYYATADNFGFKIKRPKIRGHGKACQLRFSSNGDYPFNIIGWSVYETGNRMV